MDKIRKNWKYYASAFGVSSALLAMMLFYKKYKGKHLPINSNNNTQASNNLYPLLKSEAKRRSTIISDENIKYTLFLNLKDKNTMNSDFEGSVIIHFSLNNLEDTFLDFHGKVKSMSINGKTIQAIHKNDRIYLNSSLLTITNNTVIIEFSCPYSTNEHGLRYFKSDSFENYIISNFEPFYAHTVFPCFDQPDMKANIKLIVAVHKEFEVITSSKLIQI